MQFSSRPLLWLTSIASGFLQFIGTRQVAKISFCVFKSSVSVFFVEILSFDFCVVNSECDANLLVYHSLVYSNPKMSALFFSLILSLV